MRGTRETCSAESVQVLPDISTVAPQEQREMLQKRETRETSSITSVQIAKQVLTKTYNL